MERKKKEMLKKMGSHFLTISVIFSVILFVWACGISNIDTKEVAQPDVTPQADVRSEPNSAESDPSSEPWGPEIQRRFQKATYAEIREAIRPGDVIAYSGGTFASRMVMAVTGSNVSHVGVVVPATFLDIPSEEPVVGEVTEQGLIFSPLSEIIHGENTALWWLPLAKHPASEKVAAAVGVHRGKSYDYQQATQLVLEPLAPVFADAGPQLKKDISRILADMIVPPLREKLLAGVGEGSTRKVVANFISESQLRRAVSDVLDAHLDTRRLLDPYVSRLQNQEDTRKLFCSEFVTDVLSESGVIQGVLAAQTTPIEVCLLKGIYRDEYVQFKGTAGKIRAIKQ